MTFFIHFIIAFVLSLLGTIPLGIITLTLADVTIKRGIKAGIYYSLGASVFEFIYTFVALKFINLFMDNPAIETNIRWAALIVFFGLSIYYFLSNPNPPQQKESVQDKRSSFLKGMGIASLNMLIVPYWIFLGTWLHSDGWIILDSFWILIFSIGATLGALAVFLAYAKLSELVLQKSDRIVKWTNKIIGFVFLILGIYQAVSLF